MTTANALRHLAATGERMEALGKVRNDWMLSNAGERIGRAVAQCNNALREARLHPVHPPIGKV